MTYIALHHVGRPRVPGQLSGVWDVGERITGDDLDEGQIADLLKIGAIRAEESFEVLPEPAAPDPALEKEIERLKKEVQRLTHQNSGLVKQLDTARQRTKELAAANDLMAKQAVNSAKVLQPTPEA